MRKIKIFNILAILTTSGILAWIITDFYGGMVIYLISFGMLIIPIIILYLISFFESLISILIKGWRPNRIKGLSHCILLFIICALIIFNSELFKSKRVLTAILKDDLYSYTLILRENGACDNEAMGIFGYEETFHGRYTLKGDTIIFYKVPYNNDFLPDKLLICPKQKAIFIRRDENGNFNQTKSFLNYFEIIER